MFGLAAPAEGIAPGLPRSIKSDDSYWVNARSALRWLVAELKPPRVWLPAFICPDVIHAFAQRAPLTFYDRETDAWRGQVGEREMVVVLDEFGFPAESAVFEQLRARGAIVVEDAAQALLSDAIGDHADYVVFSPRKFVGLSDGGVLGRRLGPLLVTLPLGSPPEEWLASAREAALGRARFDAQGGNREWFAQFQQVEAAQPFESYAMSAESRQLLSTAFDWPAIAAARRNNYQTLLDSLGPFALYDRLPAGVVPLGFPIVLPDRDRVRHALFAEEIFPPVHWALGDAVPREFTAAHQLTAQIMTLPCDQRYDANVMQRLADIVLREVPR